MRSISSVAVRSGVRAAAAGRRSLANAGMAPIRGMATVRSSAVVYTENGNPERVLRVEDIELDDNVKADEVLVKMLAAPITPADLTQVEGWGNDASAPRAKNARRVAGNEGIAEVVKAGSGVKNLAAGDWVVPATPAFGTWCTFSVSPADRLCKVDKFTKTRDVEHAATGVVAPALATRLLDDFAKLEAGDVIVQNGAASGVAQVVMQLAAERGLIVINIAREHNDWDELVNHFQSLNAPSITVTEEYARSPEFTRLLGDIPQPKLGIDLVGGRAGLLVAQSLASGATLVSVGNMSKQPLPLTADVLLNKDIHVRGFRLDRWLAEQPTEQRDSFLQQMAKLADEGKAKQLLAWEPFKDFDVAFERAQKRGERKVVLVMDPSEERVR